MDTRPTAGIARCPMHLLPVALATTGRSYGHTAHCGHCEVPHAPLASGPGNHGSVLWTHGPLRALRGAPCTSCQWPWQPRVGHMDTRPTAGIARCPMHLLPVALATTGRSYGHTAH